MLKKILAVLAMLYAAASFAAVDVNKAPAAELDGIKGIGPVISTRIIDERKKGSFKDWQDFIDRVKGVGEVNAAKFSAEGLTVNGAGFKGASAPAPKKDEKPSSTMSKKDEKPAAKPVEKKASAPATAPAPMTAKEEKKDAKAQAKAEAKAKKEAEKKAKAEAKAKKAEEAKAKKEAEAKAKADMKAAKKEDKKDAKAEAAKPAASAKK
ncbi:MAG: helix-hairpin-helix domain-containing protein [Ramlibacter sp.]